MRKITSIKKGSFTRHYLGFLINRFVIDIAPKILLSFELYKSHTNQPENDHLNVTVNLFSGERISLKRTKLLLNGTELILKNFTSASYTHTFETALPSRLSIHDHTEYTSHSREEKNRYYYYEIPSEEISELMNGKKIKFRFYTGGRCYKYNFSGLAGAQLKQLFYLLKNDKPSPVITKNIQSERLMKRIAQVAMVLFTIGVSSYVFTNSRYLAKVIGGENITYNHVGSGGLIFIVLMILLTALFRKKIFY